MKKALVLGIVIIIGICFSGIVSAEPYKSKNPPTPKQIMFMWQKSSKRPVSSFVGKIEVEKNVFNYHFLSKDGYNQDILIIMPVYKLDTDVWVFQGNSTVIVENLK